jgi:hypothetical protein
MINFHSPNWKEFSTRRCKTYKNHRVQQQPCNVYQCFQLQTTQSFTNVYCLSTVSTSNTGHHSGQCRRTTMHTENKHQYIETNVMHFLFNLLRTKR